MAKVLEFLGKKDLKYIGEIVLPLKRRYEWAMTTVSFHPRGGGLIAAGGRKKGGTEEWVDVEDVLKQIHDHKK